MGSFVGQATVAGTQVVNRVFEICGFGEHSIHGRVSDDEFQRELGPALAIKLGRPFGQFHAADHAKVAPINERATDAHGNTFIGC